MTHLMFHVLAHDNLARSWGASRRPLSNKDTFFVTDAGPATDMYTPKFTLFALNMARLRALHANSHAWSTTDAVWIADCDIDFTNFAAARFFHLWACAFPGGSPLVSQPIIRGPGTAPTQLWWPLHAGAWEDNVTFGRPRSYLSRGTQEQLRPVALLTDFVEMQVPLFDGAFLEWFMSTAGNIVGGVGLAQGHGWGIDNIWCGAAAFYANGTTRPHCAVLPLPVTHKDTRLAPRGETADKRGMQAVQLTCLIARLVARNVGTEQGARWASDPKTTGWFGPQGFDRGEGEPLAKVRLLQSLLHNASYRMGTPCKSTRSARNSIS